MGLVASLFSALKAEVEWLITSLAVASGSSDGAIAADSQTADKTGTAHRDDSASQSHAPISTLAEQQANNSADHSGAQHANTDDALNASANVQLTDVATHDPANLLLNADFVIETSDNGPAPNPGLMPISFESSAADLSSISMIVDAAPAQTDLDSNITLPDTSSHSGTTHSNVGQFALTSLTPQLRGDFAHGQSGGGAGGGSGGGTGLMYDTLSNGNINNGLEITIKFDSSVANAPGGLSGAGVGTFVGDVEAVANFFAMNFTTANGTAGNTQITIDIGYGEIAGSHLGHGVLGESEAYYQIVPGSTPAQEYSALQGGFNATAAVEGAKSSQQVNIPSSDPLGTSASQQWWVTTAEAKALGLATTNSSVDGYIGLATGSTFFYGTTPGSGQTSTYDFMGTVAHEMSEVMGRVTLNGGKYFGGHTPEYMPLDLFHYSGQNSPSYSGTQPGYFSVDNGATDLENFNTNSSGDFSDWATGSTTTLPVQSFPVNAFDWAGGAGTQSPVSYADYLTMEAVGWAGIGLPASTASNWTWSL